MSLCSLLIFLRALHQSLLPTSIGLSSPRALLAHTPNNPVHNSMQPPASETPTLLHAALARIKQELEPKAAYFPAHMCEVANDTTAAALFSLVALCHREAFADLFVMAQDLEGEV